MSEITIFTSMGALSGVTDLAVAYEKATGNKVIVGTRLGAALYEALDSKEPGDIVVDFTAEFDGLIERGQVVVGSPTEFARAGVGVAVRSGAPKPDIGTAEAFRQAMLNATSIGYSQHGSGLIAERAMVTLGIADQVRDKVRFIHGMPVAVFVAKGEVEVGIQQANAILPIAGADYVGPLPGDLHEHLYFSAGLRTISKQPDAARAFMAFMASPAAAEHLRKSGMEPPR